MNSDHSPRIFLNLKKKHTQVSKGYPGVVFVEKIPNKVCLKFISKVCSGLFWLYTHFLRLQRAQMTQFLNTGCGMVLSMMEFLRSHKFL